MGTSLPKARSFQERFRLESHAGSVEALLSDPRVEAICVASPHPFHAEHAIAGLRAKKAVLCEKPLTLDAASTKRVIDVAREENVFLMEAFMYRCHPLLRELSERLRAGVIGSLTHVRADFGFRVPRDPLGRLFNPSLGAAASTSSPRAPQATRPAQDAGLIEGASPQSRRCRRIPRMRSGWSPGRRWRPPAESSPVPPVSQPRRTPPTVHHAVHRDPMALAGLLRCRSRAGPERLTHGCALDEERALVGPNGLPPICRDRVP